MPVTLDALSAKGYKFVTVSELIAMEVPEQLVKKESSVSPAPAPRYTGCTDRASTPATGSGIVDPGARKSTSALALTTGDFPAGYATSKNNSW